MENLTKQQIVLVTLLVSFVTSMATGIITVSLMDQAPAGVTQTINRVVEKTIERVVQAPAQATVVTKETLIKSDDLIVAAIEKNRESIVRISREGVTDENPEPHQIFETVGFVVSNDGLIATDKVVTLFEAKRFISFSDGNILPLEVVSSPAAAPVALVRGVVSKDKTINLKHSVAIGDSSTLRLGSSVVAIGGREGDSVAPAVVTSIKTKEIPVKKSEQATTTGAVLSAVSSIEVSAEPRQALGGPLINLSGEVVGIKTSDDTSQDRTYTPISVVKDLLEKLSAAAAAADSKKPE